MFEYEVLQKMAHLLRYPCKLPPDLLGMGYGSDYAGKLQAGIDSTHSTDTLFFSKKNGCNVDLLGMGERYMAFLLEISPFVLAYRPQYPLLNPKASSDLDDYVCGILEKMPEIKRSQVMSIDIAITARDEILHPGSLINDRLTYLMLSHKRKEVLHSKPIRRRLARERRVAVENGFTYAVYSRSEHLEECGLSAKQIMIWGRDLDFDASWVNASRVAECVVASYAGERLWDFLAKIGVELRMDTEYVLQLFAAAVNFGLLSIDLSFEVGERRKIYLLKRTEVVPPWISFCGKANCCLEG
ncbi:hypothetical protein [Paraburkholderia caribensis]|uniref:hypothetical protein n=1 Tax=Paraburkholderia caribensis TaxID=75105 RepID=UPI0031DAB737